MHLLSLLASILASGCLLAPAQKPTQSATTLSGADAFPEPKSGLEIAISDGEDVKIEKLLDQFSKITGHALLIADDVRQVARNASTGLNRSVEVPAHQVYPFVETVLVQNDFVLTLLSAQEPRLLGVHSRTQDMNRGSPMSQAIHVPSDRIAAYAGHPAILVRTVVDLPSVDVRTLANSMRTMFTDASTQQIIPVGNSNSLLIVGLGRDVATLVEVLRECDERARIADETRQKEKAEEKELERQRRSEERKEEEKQATRTQGEPTPPAPPKAQKPN